MKPPPESMKSPIPPQRSLPAVLQKHHQALSSYLTYQKSQQVPSVKSKGCSAPILRSEVPAGERLTIPPFQSCCQSPSLYVLGCPVPCALAPARGAGERFRHPAASACRCRETPRPLSAAL